jgi:hypothetical protein
VDRIPDLHFDIFASTNHPHIHTAQLSQQVKRRLRLLAKGQAQGVVFTALFDGLLHVARYAVEPIRRSGPVDPLMRPLVIVIVDPVIEALAGIGERREHRLG